MTPRAPGSYLLTGPVDWQELTTGLTDLRLEQDPGEEPTSFRLLDSHDQSLRAKGAVLLEYDDRMHLLQAGGESLSQPSGPGHFPGELPEGPVRAVTEALFPLRCFLTLVEGRMCRRSLRVVDDEGKTQLRLEEIGLETAAGRLSLVTLRPLRGYDRAPALIASALAAAGAGPLSGAAVLTTLAPDLVPYVAKPDIAIAGGDSAFDVAVRTISAYLAVARANEPGVIEDLDSEFLHDYRVALRKIRSALSLFKEVFGQVQTEEMKVAFSALMAPTGRLRDLDVYLMEREAYMSRVPEALRPGLDVMFDAFAKERRSAHAALAKHLKSRAYQGRISALVTGFDHPEGFVRGEAGTEAASGLARRLIWKRYRKICKIAAGIGADTPDDEVHELRIACKKFRYLIEFFAPLFPAKSVRKLIKAMKALQDNLGNFNDYSVQQAALGSLVASGRLPTGPRGLEAAQSIGALIAVLHQEQIRERARVMETFAAFDSASTRALVARLCQHREARA